MPVSSDKGRSNEGEEVVPPEIMEKIEAALQGVFHGSVTLIVQDARIIQIEKTEKIRLC